MTRMVASASAVSSWAATGRRLHGQEGGDEGQAQKSDPDDLGDAV